MSFLRTNTHTHTPWSIILGYGITRDREARTVSMDARKLIADLVGSASDD